MIEMRPIGVIHSPFTELEGMPIQPTGAIGVKGAVEVFDEYQGGLKDLDGFSHIILIYLFHKSVSYSLEVVPFMDTAPRGLFSTRAPRRPNPIGLSIIRLDRIENNILHVQDVDVLDGTPLLDIKPYVPKFDSREETLIGWLEHSKDTVQTRKSDDRFKEATSS